MKFNFEYIKHNYKINNEEKDRFTTVIDAIVIGDKDKKIIYSGLLNEYHVDENDELISIQLKNTHRKPFSKSKEEDNYEHNYDSNTQYSPNELYEVKYIDESFYPINGHSVIIQWQDILNMNITYCILDNDNDLLILKNREV